MKKETKKEMMKIEKETKTNLKNLGKNKKKQNKQIKKVLKILDIILSSILLILSNIIICTSYYLKTVLRNVNFYEIIYHLDGESIVGGKSAIIEGIKIYYPLFIVLLIILFLPYIYQKTIKIYIEIKSKNRKNKTINLYPNIIFKVKILYAIMVLIISLLIIVKTVKLDEYIINTSKITNIYENYYVNPNKVKITLPKNKKNLIILYLESMESSLVSKNNGGIYINSRIPELENLALENLNFSNTNKIGGAYNLTSTAWTVSGLVASTSGTPLLTTISNAYSEKESILPNTRTMGDILKDEGYNLEIIMGSKITYAGRNKYYENHGNYIVFDYNQAVKEKLISSDYYVWWGYEDKKLYNFAKQEIIELSEEEQPFAVSILTVDTHFKDGYLDEDCKTPFKDQLSNVYACSSKMAYEFIVWIQAQDFYENTTIVIIGDHISMNGGYFKDYPNYQRTIYNAFINSSITTINNKNREFSSLDMYPTILASIGASIEGEQLGFGVNLFSEKETLIERLGYTRFNENLNKNSEYYNKYLLE